MNDPYIIAEIGINHNGSFELAKLHIDLAVTTGCAAVKFQTFSLEKLLYGTVTATEYQRRSSFVSQNDMLKNCILSYVEMQSLYTYAQSHGIDFLSTAYDFSDADQLASLGTKTVKLASISFVEFTLIEHCLGLFEHIYISTGMTTSEEIQTFAKVFSRELHRFTVFHCVSAYPCPIDQSCMHYVDELRSVFPFSDIGFSDHCISNIPAIAGALNGVRVFEKHITIDRSLPGPDHEMSLDSNQLHSYVGCLRDACSLASVRKYPFRTLSSAESHNIIPMRRSLRAFRNLDVGERLESNNIYYTRPQIYPGDLDIRLGMLVKTFIPKDTIIKLEMLDV